MLAGGLDQLYRDALGRPHRAVCRLEAWRDGARVDTFGTDAFTDTREIRKAGVPYLGGSVRCTLTSRVTREMSLTVPEFLVPYLDEEDGLLTTPGTFLRALRGIELGDGREYAWPVFYGMISNLADAGDGTVEIVASDRANEVEQAKFRAPRASAAGAPARTQVMELIEEEIPDARFDISPDFASETIPVMAWEYDRARALDEIATAVGGLWWATADGTFTLRPVPWTTYAPPLLDVSEGEPDGVIQQAVGNLDFENVVNSVTAYGERADGKTPVWAYVENTNPSSPTRANGPIGRRQRLLRLQTPQTQPTVQGAALTYLRRGAGVAETWQWSMPVDAAMELGDPLRLRPRRRRKPIVQVVTGYTMPLGVAANMTVQGRSMIVGEQVFDDDAG
jgi:hypothetical protein